MEIFSLYRKRSIFIATILTENHLVLHAIQIERMQY